MMAIIRKYYLSFFVGFLLLLLWTLFTRESQNSNQVKGLICLGGALAGSIIVGTLYYLVDTKWGPAKRKKVLLKTPFTELFQNGFSKHNDMLVGTIHGYTVIIHYTWLARKSTIQLAILFDVGFSVHASEDLLNAIINRNQPANRFSSLAHEWHRNSISCTFEYNFKPPSYEKLMTKMEELTAILLREGLIPLSLDKARSLQRQVN
jgi:hypothetical protein